MTIRGTNTMNKALIVFAIIFIGTIIPNLPALAAGQELNVLTWCDHTDPDLLRPFEQKHKVRINMKEYDGTGSVLWISCNVIPVLPANIQKIRTKSENLILIHNLCQIHCTN